MPAAPAHRTDPWRLVEGALVAVALVAGAVLRFVADSPLWLDEALSVDIAAGPLADIPDALRRDGHPPLYYALLHGWMEVFGTSAFAARALSGIIGLGAVGAVVVLARRLDRTRLVVPAAVVMAVLPFAIRYSSEARMYSLVTLLVALGWLALDSARRSPTVWRLVAVAAVSGALLLTHYWAIYLLGVVGLGLLWRVWRGPTRDVDLRLAVGVAAGGVAFVPWLGAFSYQAAHTGTPWATAPRPTQVLSESFTGMTGGFSPESVLLVLVLGALAVRAVAPSRRWVRTAAAAAVGTLVVGSLAGLATQSAFQSRYAAVVVPMVALVVAAGVATITDRRLRVAVLAAVVVLGVGSVLVDLRNDRSQSGVIAAAIESGAAPGDVVVVCPDQLGPALSRELDGSGLDQLAYPLLTPTELVDWVDYAERHEAADPAAVAAEIVARVPDTASLWLVWNDSYRTVEGQCSALIDALVASRPGPESLVVAAPERYFEHANLFRFAPTG